MLDSGLAARLMGVTPRKLARDTRGLRVLRDALGDAFGVGIVLTTGELTYRLDDRIIVAPVDALWREHV